MRGRRVARLSAIDEADPLADLRARAHRGALAAEASACRQPPDQGRWVGVRSRRRAAALIVYIDTSALVKLVFDEPGSDLVGELWDRAASVVSGQLAYPETRAAAAAAHHTARLDAGQLRAAVRAIDGIYGELTTVSVDTALARAAGALAERRALRGYDAVHLASALSLDSPDVVLATWDRALADAAGKEGLAVAPGAPGRA